MGTYRKTAKMSDDENAPPPTSSSRKAKKVSTPNSIRASLSSPLQALRAFTSLSNRGSVKSPVSKSSPLGKFFYSKGSGGKTPEKQTTPSRGKDLETSVADNDEIKGAAVQSTGGSAVTPSRYCAIASLDEAAFDEEVKICIFFKFFLFGLFAQLSRIFQ